MQHEIPFSPNYINPLTRAGLEVSGDSLRDSAGEAVYPLQAGVPQFHRFAPVETEPIRLELARLNRLASQNGWQSALCEVYGKDSPLVRYVTLLDRASFIDLLPLSRQSDVLEIGPGLGQFTTVLAGRSRSVCALEVVAGQAEFAAERCRQEGLTNVHLASGGDDCRLPYADNTFNVGVLNLVFEWCASRSADETQIEVQRRLLAEMFRVLKPGGYLYLATKNRYALRNLLGKPDEHCYDVPFGSALPRWFASFVVRLKGHDRPFGILHSHNELRAMLRESGFDRIDSFWATPEMRYPTHYVSTDAAAVRDARTKPGFVQGESRSTRFLMRFIPASLVRHFTPGLAFLAYKAP